MKEYILPEKEIKDKIILLTMSIGDTLENATKQGETTVQLIKDLSEFNNTSLEHEFNNVCGYGFLQTRDEKSTEIKDACKSLGINI
jgi:hypothetical protein